MNYIKRLEEQKIMKDVLLYGIQELQGYLTSSKFHDDTTVQVTDVLNRLQAIKNAAFDVEI